MRKRKTIRDNFEKERNKERKNQTNKNLGNKINEARKERKKEKHFFYYKKKIKRNWMKGV